MRHVRLFFAGFAALSAPSALSAPWDSFHKCGDPSCHSRDELRAMLQAKQATEGKRAPKPAPAPPGSLASVRPGCPLDRDQLGASTWSLLHTMAAYYPEEPTPEQQTAATSFVNALSVLYPCPHCASDFLDSLAASPPRVSSRADFSLWVCEQHNTVSKKLGKKEYPCSMDALDAAWRTGRPWCWEDGQVEGEDSIPQ